MKITIVGSGLIGQSMAVRFLRYGHNIVLYDVNVAACEEAPKSIIQTFTKNPHFLNAQTLDSVSRLMTVCTELKDAIDGSDFVYECVFEDISVKKSLFAKLDLLVNEETILISSTSCIMPSLLFSDLKSSQNCLVAHPVNPPLFIPLIELVPSTKTLNVVMSKTKDLFIDIGMKPVVLNKEIDGFALNRVQYAIIKECWNLVQEGIISVEDIDLVMTEGLAPRYSVLGPLAIMQFNAPNGVNDYLERYSDGISRIANSFEPSLNLQNEPTKEALTAHANNLFPLEKRNIFLQARNSSLKQIYEVKQEFNKEM